MSAKKLMLLGGLRYLIPVIEAAHKQGYYVITCDYIPDNIAHSYSDEYVNVSIIDKDAVLREAKRLNIDGIMSFAVDPGVVTASYVQSKMGLPSFGPYDSVCILQNKNLFREFLKSNGFNTPWAYSFSSLEDAINNRVNYSYPLIVKPTDSAGSKGVSRVDDESCLMDAFNYAFDNSISKNIIVEEFIEKQGCSSDSDCFSINGELKFVSFSAQRFDDKAPNPYTPSAYSWPSTMTKEQETELRNEIQRLLFLLNMNTTVYNVETRVGVNGKPYIMEVSPRGGGNRLSEMVRIATKVDLITAAVRASVGDDVCDVEQKDYNGHYAEVILHSSKNGRFRGLNISKEISPFVIEEDLWVRNGDKIDSFNGANNAIGTLVLKFDTLEQLNNSLLQLDWLEVIVDDEN